MNVALVIAAYNEAGNLGPLTERIIHTMDSLPGMSWTLTLVTAGSDGTGDIAAEYARSRSNIRACHSAEPEGLGPAFRKGFAMVPSDADVVVTMDADLNHQPEEIPRLLDAYVRRGVDIVVGSRRLSGSAVENAPAWKTTISRVVNFGMKVLAASPVRDMTSGFRVYRADVVRQLSFRNTGFAFLPEILMEAQRAGLKIVEEPIRFIFRQNGESKMSIATTSLSYIQLFFGPISKLAAIVLLASVLARVFISFPVHQYVGDSDAMLAGICATDISDGNLPLFFPSGYRLSAQSCYMTAFYAKIFGSTREAAAAAGVTWGILFVLFLWLGLRTALGEAAAVCGALIAGFPPVQVVLFTEPPWGYGEIMAWLACSLWFGSVLMFRPERRVPMLYLLFGLAAGLAFWASPQSLMATLPLIAVMVMARALSQPLAIGASAGGFALGVFAYLIVIAQKGLQPFTSSFATKPVDTWQQLSSNIQYMLGSALPVLLMNSEPPPSTRSAGVIVVLTIMGAIALVGIVVWWFGFRRSGALKDPVALCALVALLITLTTLTLYPMSGAGSIRGWTVRYLAPLALVFPLAAAVCFAAARRGPPLSSQIVGFCIVAMALATSSTYNWPGTPERSALQQALADDASLVSWLKRNGRDAVMGDYWLTYRLNYGFGREVKGIAVPVFADFASLRKQLKGNIRLALIDRDQAHLTWWMQRLGLTGPVQQVPGGSWVALIDAPVDAARFDAIAGAFN